MSTALANYRNAPVLQLDLGGIPSLYVQAEAAGEQARFCLPLLQQTFAGRDRAAHVHS
ncbi:MAG TPA: hypothetical protein VJV78_29265 [Polyangiales bacterium]|nr:hypothetical protein [Polyangiales bacterium]